MKKVLLLLLALSLLCGCSAGEQNAGGTASQTSQTDPTQTDPVPTVTEPVPSQTESAATEGTVATVPVETDPVYYNPLTGETVEAPSQNRVTCIMLNNSRAAMPQHGVGDADILYEILIEGETRCMGVYYDISKTETFGSIRSARPYFISIAQSYNALYIHGGGSPEGMEYLETTGWDHLDGVSGKYCGSYFYRTRGEQGYALEHTLFIRPDGILGYSEKLGYDLSATGSETYGLAFDDETVIVGKSAETITVWFNISGGTPSPQWHKSTTLNYDAETGLYYANQYGGEYVDGNNSQQLSFRNILILRAHTVMQGTVAQPLTIDVVGSGSGYFVCNGQLVDITWHRESVSDPFTYTLAASGAPVTFGVGKTYIAVIPEPSTVTYE